MIIIDKNLSHGSDVVLSRDFYKDNKVHGNYFKSSSVTHGIQNIRRELEGFSWYLERTGYHYEFDVLHQTEKYIKVRCPRVIGKIPNAKLGYAGNIFFIEEIVNHYIAVWSSYSFGKGAPVHGDLSLFGNIIFTDTGPFIIDWEHFLLNGAPIGFDALYFLFELLCLDKYTRTDHVATQHLIKMIRLLESKNCISKYFKEGYLRKVIDFIEADKNIWGSQKYKLPLHFFDQSVIEFVDAQLK